MTLNIPATRKAVSNRIKSDVQNQLPESNPYLRNSFLQALIFGLSGRVFDLYKTEKRLLDLLFWDTTEDEYLERAAAIFGITKNAATESEGYLTIAGIAGTIVPADTRFQNSDGKEIKTLGSKTVAITTITISTLTQTAGVATATTSGSHLLASNIEVVVSGAVESEYNGTVTVSNILNSNQFQFSVSAGASSPATGSPQAVYTTASLEVQSVDQGDDNNIDEGDKLTITSPIAGLENDGYAQYEGLQGASDEEDDEDFRERFLFRVQNPVALFNAIAIELKAKEITGVTRVFVFNVDNTVRTISNTSLTNAGNQLAIYESSSPHGLIDGQRVTITAAAESQYNVTGAKIIILSTAKFAYVITGTPVSPSISTPDAQVSTVEEGDVKIFFTRDNDDSILPSSSEITDVKNKILEIKPAHTSDDSVEVKSPTGKTIDFEFASITDDTSTMRDAIEANLISFFQEGTYVGRDLLENEYESAIFATVDGETGDKLDSFVLNSPTGDITLTSEELPVLGTISYV